MVKRYLACAVAIASALLASACGGSEHAASLPKKAALVTTPSVQPLTVEQQVEAAVRHYYDVMNSAIRTGNTSELPSLILPTCSCSSAIHEIERVTAIGSYSGLSLRLESLRVHDIHGGTASVLVEAQTSGYAELNRGGSRVAAFRPQASREDLFLVNKQGAWLVSGGVMLWHHAL